MSFPHDEEDVMALNKTKALSCLDRLIMGIKTWADGANDPREPLAALISALNGDPTDDMFGTEGWRHGLLGED